MKKLLTACAVAGLSAAVFGDVTSANVVGYANNTNINLSGGAVASAMFMTVGSKEGSTTFKDLVPLKADGSVADSMSVSIQYLNYDGSDSTTYMWRGTFWRNMDKKTDASAEEIKAGQGLWFVNNSGEKIELRTSGEVSKSESVVELNMAGGKPVGNPYPMAITFADILPKLKSSGELAASMSISIQYLNYDGSDARTYMWRGTFWRNMDTKTDASEEVIPAGKGLWIVNNSGEAVNIHIVAPTSDL